MNINFTNIQKWTKLAYWKMLARSHYNQPIVQSNLENIKLLIIEKVSNLLCPAAYDLDENLLIVLLSVTQEEDKQLNILPCFKLPKA
ncbi:hypothetical protein IQ264_06310 [Phormidium sp. LEGE 05292]|uniref:hypothetical protein n=1 Tax=[Phormidium] sp. LEGE 05292 TaxID=767427 RepID=UPI0018812FDF|nr:hypothetical protein [Phormidium sp. LEGE 05292]MBE9225048.1 hypothetical protein [Phormidium sp. LEGE 05292]